METTSMKSISAGAGANAEAKGQCYSSQANALDEVLVLNFILNRDHYAASVCAIARTTQNQ